MKTSLTVLQRRQENGVAYYNKNNTNPIEANTLPSHIPIQQSKNALTYRSKTRFPALQARTYCFAAVT